MGDPREGFEILEHTADVGVRAWGATLERTFEQATRGLLDVVGAWAPGSGERCTIEVDAHDLGGLLVDWLGEVLYLQDARDVVVAGIEVEEVRDDCARGWVDLAERPLEIEGTAVKAVTYHQLAVERHESGWEATVFLDI